MKRINNFMPLITAMLIIIMVFVVQPAIADPANDLGSQTDSLSFSGSFTKNNEPEQQNSKEAGTLEVEKIYTGGAASQYYEAGQIFEGDYGWLYVPYEVSEETNFVLYVPGGSGGYGFLDYYGIQEYVQEFKPNAIMLFRHVSGQYNKEETIQNSMEVLTHTAAEFGFEVKSMIVAGASNGAYTAMHATAAILEDYKISVPYCLLYDTGMNWDFPDSELVMESDKLTDDQIDVIRKHDTILCLFEQPYTDTSIPEIKRLVDSYLPVMVIECADADHEWIMHLGLSLGTLSWALGEQELNKVEYRNIVWLTATKT